MNDLKYLQKKLEQVLENWYESDSKTKRIEIFNIFNKLTIKILQDKFGITGERCYNFSFHYSLDLLNTFLDEYPYHKGFTGNEATEYISHTIENYINEGKVQLDNSIILDYEVFKSTRTPPEEMANYEILSEINNILLIFFSERDIKRYLPLATTIVSTGNYSKISNLADQNFKYFSMLLISLGKRLSRYYSNGVSNLNHSPNNLSVLIASINNKVPRELILSCDLDSLSNLVDFAGGSEIRIPTRDEIDGAFNDLKESIKYSKLQEESIILEDNFPTEDSLRTIDTTYNLFIAWLKENKEFLSRAKLDRLSDILSE